MLKIRWPLGSLLFLILLLGCTRRIETGERVLVPSEHPSEFGLQFEVPPPQVSSDLLPPSAPAAPVVPPPIVPAPQPLPAPINILPGVLPPPPPALRFLLTAAGAGGGPHVVYRELSRDHRLDFFAYDPSFQGGVRAALCDFDGDGIAEPVVAPATGGRPTVSVLYPNHAVSFDVYPLKFHSGIFVACGDLDGDRIPEIVTGPGEGGGPNIKIFRADGTAWLGGTNSFMAFEPTFLGGVRVAVGDVNGDGRAEIFAAPGRGREPRVRILRAHDQAELSTLLAFDVAFRGGVQIAAGDVNGDGLMDLVAGADEGGGPHVQVFGANGVLMASFFAYDAAFGGGVRVAAADLDNDGRAEVITGAGPGGGPHVKVFAIHNGAVERDSFMAFAPAFTGGVYVASTATRAGVGIMAREYPRLALPVPEFPPQITYYRYFHAQLNSYSVGIREHVTCDESQCLVPTTIERLCDTFALQEAPGMQPFFRYAAYPDRPAFTTYVYKQYVAGLRPLFLCERPRGGWLQDLYATSVADCQTRGFSLRRVAGWVR